MWGMEMRRDGTLTLRYGVEPLRFPPDLLPVLTISVDLLKYVCKVMQNARDVWMGGPRILFNFWPEP